MTTDQSAHATEVLERVSALMAQERWADALSCLDDEAELVASDPRMAWNRGWTLYKLHRLQDAASQLDAACSLSPDNPINPWALGVVQGEMKDYTNAEQNLLRALRLKDSALARLNLANVYSAQGRLAEAENIHLEGLRLQPAHRERVEAFADFLSDIGQRERAQGYYEQAEQLPSRDERRKRVRPDS